MLDPRGLDQIAALEQPRERRLDLSQTACDQLRYLAGERTGLLLDIDHPQRSFALRLPCPPLAEPLVDDFETSQRVAPRGIPAIEPIEDVEFVRWPLRAGDSVDG